MGNTLEDLEKLDKDKIWSTFQQIIDKEKVERYHDRMMKKHEFE